MRDVLVSCADESIRRACAFTGLGIATTMLGLSYDTALSFHCGAQLLALLTLGLAWAGWRAPQRNLRHSETYALLKDRGLPRRQLASPEVQATLGAVMRERLWWHAERIGSTTLALFLAAAVIRLFG